MAGIRGRSGPPGNQNAFRHGLAAIAQRRVDGVFSIPQNNQSEKKSCPAYWPIRAELDRSVPAMPVLAEIIEGIYLLMTFNQYVFY
jgi:hypothetical protein